MSINVSPLFRLNRDNHTVSGVDPSGREIHSYTFDDNSLPVKIFRDRMTGWFFEPALNLLDNGHDVAAVQLVTPLIEALEEHYRGTSSRNKSCEFFKSRAKQIFGIEEEPLNPLYKGIRCGFAHHGFLKDDDNEYNILLNCELPEPIRYDDKVLYIDSRKYVEKIKGAYEEYYSLLEPDSEYYVRFKNLWDKDWQMSLRIPGIAGTVVGAGHEINSQL